MSKYLVVIHPPVGNKDPNSASYTVAKPPQVKWVTARSVKEAVDCVRVEPGGHALVVAEDKVIRFDRAKEAPLEERSPDGNPMPQAAVAA